MGGRRNFSRGGQHRQFTYLFQIADDAMQMNVNKTLCPFYAPKIMPRVHGRRNHCIVLSNVFTPTRQTLDF